MVPVEPTKEMLEVDTVPLLCLGNPNTPRVIQWRLGLYGSMLAAAPNPPQPICDEAKERELFEFNLMGRGISKERKDGVGYVSKATQNEWFGWLACAQSRAKAGEIEL